MGVSHGLARIEKGHSALRHGSRKPRRRQPLPSRLAQVRKASRWWRAPRVAIGGSAADNSAAKLTLATRRGRIERFFSFHFIHPLLHCRRRAGGDDAGFLLARAGVEVVVLEKHADFLRDFRGDTIHPSTLNLMNELGFLDEFLQLPHQKLFELEGWIGDVRAKVVDSRICRPRATSSR